MFTKERLLAGLNELAYVEEGVITMYANFAKVLVNETEGMEPEKKKDIEKMLNVLYRDSTRHKEVIDGLIEKVERDVKNEY